MDNLGLGELLSHKNLPSGSDPVNVYTVINDLKREAEFWKKEAKANEELLLKQ